MNNSRSCKRIFSFVLVFFLVVSGVVAGFACLMQVSNIELQYTNGETTIHALHITGEDGDDVINVPKEVEDAKKKMKYRDYLHFSMVSYFTIGYGDIIILPTSGKLILWLEMLASLVINAGFIAFLVMELMKPMDEVIIYHSVFLQKQGKHITVPIKNFGNTLVDAQFKLEFGVDNPEKNETNYLESISDSKPFFNKRKQLSIKEDGHSKEFDAFVEQLVGLKKDDKLIIRIFISGMCIDKGSKLAKSETFTIQKKENGEFDNVFACEKLHILAPDVPSGKNFFVKAILRFRKCFERKNFSEISGAISDFQNVMAASDGEPKEESKFENITEKDKCKIDDNITKEKFIKNFFES